MELENKTALITGATSGIGAETAKLFAEQGAEVVLTGRRVELGEQVVAEIVGNGGKARFVPADLADLQSVKALAEAVDHVDVLVNNAAIFPMAPTVDQTAEAYDQALAANVRGPYFLTAAVVPKMLANGGGSIVNVTTMAARIGLPGLSVYSASKAALESLTRTWAAEFAAGGVRVNSLSPGPTRTPMTTEMMGDAAGQMGDTTLLARLASTSEIAQGILFLASERSSYITGATINADGGRTAI